MSASYKYLIEELSMRTYADLAKESVGGLLRIFTAHEDWRRVWRFDEHAQKVVAVDPPVRLDAERSGVSNHDVAAVRTWLGAQPVERKRKAKQPDGTVTWETYRGGLDASVETIRQAISLAAGANRFHPVRDYLDGLERPSLEDAHALLDGLADSLGLDDPMEWLKRTLVAAVRRVRQPGCKHDYILVLIGEQGLRKSTLVKVLFDPWFQDNLPDLGNKAAANALRGFWGIELGELEKLLRADDATVKAFLSRCEDVFDQKYEADVSRFPRQCIFIGTTNEPDCLRDASGNRRYWPVRVTKHMDVDAVAGMKDAIWAAANVVAETDFRAWMDAEEEARADDLRREFSEVDAWQGAIEGFCEGRESVRIEEVWQHVAATGRGTVYERPGELAKLGRAEQIRIGKTLRRLGCQRSHGVWRVPERLAAKPLRQRVAPAVPSLARALPADARADAAHEGTAAATR